MAKTIIKGDDLMVFDSTGKSIAYATGHTLTVTGSTVETNSKDHGIYGGTEVQKLTWEVTSENLFTTEEFDALFDAMTLRSAVTIYFGTKAAPANATDTIVDGDYAAWGLGQNVNGSTAVGSYSSTGTGTGTAYTGKAFITSLTANANNGENATFSVTFTGSGKIVKAS